MELKSVVQRLKTAHIRAVFLFDGNTHWLHQQRKMIQQHIPRHIYLSVADPHAVAMHRYRDYLGSTNNAVILDFSQGTLHADALAALAGTIRGGGMLLVLLPEHDTAFKKRLIQTANKFKTIHHVTPETTWHHVLQTIGTLSLPTMLPPTLPTSSQQEIINSMLELPGTCHVLMADRGRGKSATLGLACAGWHSRYRGRELIVTGPRPAAVEMLLTHANDSARFVPWDKLLRDHKPQSIRLVIDEAAAIPMHILQELVYRFSVWAVASTVDGYEGCGRGFAIRFVEWLTQQQLCKIHQLDEPLRWSETDEVEPWFNEALLMKSTQPAISNDDMTSFDLGEVVFTDTHASQLSEAELTDVIGLLLEAHYQSSPNDLRLLLDDPHQQLLLAHHEKILTGVIWYSCEGQLPESLHQPIMNGQRRINGQILPQAIGFYFQQPEVLHWRWWRITRIAVSERVRRRGVGLKLLQQLQVQAQTNQIDALGSSFGANPDVLSFWQHSLYQIIRLGRKLNMASGYPNALVAYGLNPSAKSLLKQLHQFCQSELYRRKNELFGVNDAMYNIAKGILKGFAYGNLPFTEAQFAWCVCDRKYPLSAAGLTLPGLILSISDDLATITRQYGYSSQQSMQRQLRQVAREYLELIH